MNRIDLNLNALLRYSITPNQYVFLFLIHTRQHMLMNTFSQKGPGFSAEEIDNLVERNLLMNLNRPGEYYMDFFVLTDAVGKDLFDQNREKAANEFWNAYPILLRNPRTGENYSLLNTDKQQFFNDYYIRVGYCPQKHRRVMEALEYAIETDLISMTIRQWLDSEQWTCLLELKEMTQVV